MTVNQPLVSVVIPCYNAARTLPLAMASLLAQTYTNWECIIIDDGSRDNLLEIVHIVDDERIRFHRFEENHGRAVARQQALDMAQGDYLAMLDADDWIYPWKLDRQVEVMKAHPELAVLSTGMALVDSTNKIIAVRGQGNQSDTIKVFSQLFRPAMPHVAHAPAIIRMDAAKANSYDLGFTVAEDVDFLLRILLRHSYGILPEILYAYSEIDSYSIQKMAQSFQSNRRMFSKYKRQYLLAAYVELAKSCAKEYIYRLSSFLQADQYLVKYRSQVPTEDQKEQFQRAREIVFNAGKVAFTDTVYGANF